MADPSMNVTGVSGGRVEKANVAGVVHGGMGNTYVRGPDSIKDMIARTKKEIELKTEGMVRVSVVDDIVYKMNSGQQWITITGNAGEGKTTIGYLVMKEFLQKNVKVFTVYKPEEYDQIENIKEDSVIMLDDRFGAFRADEQNINKWRDVLQKILTFSETNQQVIFISRTNVIKEGKEYLGHLSDSVFAKDCVVDLSKRELSEKLIDERLKILDYHLQNKKVALEHGAKQFVCKMRLAHGFPHCSKMFSELMSKGYAMNIKEFFETPLNFLDITTTYLYKHNCEELFKLMIKNNGKLNIHAIDDHRERQALLKVEREQEGSYIIELKNGICEFTHPSVYESVLSVINKNDPRYCVTYATLSVIRQKMLIATCDEEDSNRAPCYIVVKPIPAVVNALAERFREEMVERDFSVFEHRLCESREFCEALVSCFVLTDGTKNGSKQSINQLGKDDKTMLWTAVYSERIVAAQTLVKAGADLEIQDERGRTPLLYLCQIQNTAHQQYHVHMDTIRMVISQGKGNVNIRDQIGQTPLHYICQLKMNTDYKHRLLMDTIRMIINEGDVNVCDQFGQTPLHYLLKSQTLTSKEIKWIINEGKGDLNISEQHKSTPLHNLCYYSGLQLETVDLVIKEGRFHFNDGDEHGTTPFHYNCESINVHFDVVLQIVNTANGDLNKQDKNGITPLHVLCKGSLPTKDILKLIKEGDKADMYGNTPLHFLCRRRGINTEISQQQLKQIPRTDMEKQNDHGNTPMDYLKYKDACLPWTDGMINRSAADLVLCRMKYGENWITVLGRAMTLNSERVHWMLQVEGMELTNMAWCGKKNTPGQFQVFIGTCSCPLPLLPSPSPLESPSPSPLESPSPSPLESPSYWETQSTLRWKESVGILLEMGVVEGDRNMDEFRCISDLGGSVCVSVRDRCHSDHVCIVVLRRDQEDRRGHQVGECVPLPLTSGVDYTLTFGLVLDVGRGRVAFLERGKLLCKVDVEFSQEVFPMFYVESHNSYCATRMRLISGREISVTDEKIQLIQEALSG